VIKIDKSSKVKSLFTKQVLFDWDNYTITDEKYVLFGLDLSNTSAFKAALEKHKVDFKYIQLLQKESQL